MLNLIELKSINFDNMNFQNFSPILTPLLDITPHPLVKREFTVVCMGQPDRFKSDSYDLQYDTPL